MNITRNNNVHKCIPPSLHNRSRRFLITAIQNLPGRDFEKDKMLIAGIYLRSAPDRLVGLAEMFNCKKERIRSPLATASTSSTGGRQETVRLDVFRYSYK